MKSTFSVLFFVKKDKQKINGSYPIFVRITIDGVASRFNSKLDVQPKLWDGKAQAKPPDVLRKLPASTDCWMI